MSANGEGKTAAGDRGAPDPGGDPGTPAILPAALRRDLSSSPLHRLLRAHLATFLARFEDEHGGRGLPRHVESEFRALLRCGDPTFGFCRLQCRHCQDDLLVPFSCKGRAFCPSCGGRRMNEVAAHLVDHVLPPVPIRQWVLSLPWHLRFALARDPELLRKVASAFIRAVSASYRRRARRGCENQAAPCFESPPTPSPRRFELTPGAVNFVQRFASSLGLNIHFHALFLDGVHVSRGPTDAPEFHPAEELSPTEVQRVHRDAMRRIHRVLHAAGRGELIRSDSGDDTDAGANSAAPDDPSGSLLPLLQAASIQDRIALGPDAGRRIPRLRDPAVDLRPGSQSIPDPAALSADAEGFSLHAATRVDANERDRLEALIRYVARPSLSQGRLEIRGDGKVKWNLRRPWRDGTRAFVFEPLSFLERLAALVPHPREHSWTYHGSIAPASALRDRVVPAPASTLGSRAPCARSRSWAELLQRTFAEDVLRCPRCGGCRHHIATVTDPLVIRRILGHIGARHGPLTLAPARPPPQSVMQFC